MVYVGCLLHFGFRCTGKKEFRRFIAVAPA